MGRFLDFVFNRFFLGMIATAFFWLLTLAGGIILGLAPASATLMSLYAEHGYSFREYSLKEAWSLYKQNFVSSNLIFYSFLGCGSSFDLWFVSLGAIASSDHCSFDCDPFECPSSCPDLFGLYSIFKITSLFCLVLSK